LAQQQQKANLRREENPFGYCAVRAIVGSRAKEIHAGPDSGGAMNSVYIAATDPMERARLKALGVDEDADGLGMSENDTWTWISSTGTEVELVEKTDLLQFEIDSRLSGDFWFFSRIKFTDANEFIYLIDAGYLAGSYTICGIAGASPHEAIAMLARAVRLEDWRIPEKISAEEKIGISRESVIEIFSSLDYYKENPDQLVNDANDCCFSLD
jgi:hypothetical protein